MDERREDWHRGVDENLAALNVAQRVWDREVDRIHKSLAEIDSVLRGDPDRDTDGVIARLHQLENSINLMRAILLKDAAGGRGLVGRVEVLESGEHRSENRWKFATALAVAIVSLIGLIVTNWEHIEKFVNRRATDPIEQMIDKAKHPKPKHRRIIVRQEPESEEDSP